MRVGLTTLLPWNSESRIDNTTSLDLPLHPALLPTVHTKVVEPCHLDKVHLSLFSFPMTQSVENTIHPLMIISFSMMELAVQEH